MSNSNSKEKSTTKPEKSKEVGKTSKSTDIDLKVSSIVEAGLKFLLSEKIKDFGKWDIYLLPFLALGYVPTLSKLLNHLYLEFIELYYDYIQTASIEIPVYAEDAKGGSGKNGSVISQSYQSFIQHFIKEKIVIPSNLIIVEDAFAEVKYALASNASFTIGKGMYCRQKDSKTLVLYSTIDSIRVTCLKEYIDKIYCMYDDEEIVDLSACKISTLTELGKYPNRSKTKFNYVTSVFETKKKFGENLFIPKHERMINYIDRFTEKGSEKAKKMYAKSGQTYKACMLFHGPPGNGKTSMIKSILMETKREGIKVDLSLFTTNTQFRELFVDGDPFDLSKVCFIFEDCDSFSNSHVLFSRDYKDSKDSKKATEIDYTDSTNRLISLLKGSSADASHVYPTSDLLSLSGILNVLDGIVELTDAMVIFTSNHINQFDPAFTRPGRIDFVHAFTNPTVDIIILMLSKHFEVAMNTVRESSDNLVDCRVSAAYVQTILFDSVNYLEAIEKICLLY